MSGLLAEIERKNGARIAQTVASLSKSALYRLLSQSGWDET
jgi:hypothetical protein